MKKWPVLAAFVATVSVSSFASAGSLDLGARVGTSLDEAGNSIEFVGRFFPIPLISLSASVGYGSLHYDKGLYQKKSDVTPVGGFVNAHVPLVPFIKPYAGVGGIYYNTHNTDSTNPADGGAERSGTMTVQAGADISLPLPMLYLNVEARRLLDDHQTQLFGGVWLRF